MTPAEAVIRKRQFVERRPEGSKQSGSPVYTGTSCQSHGLLMLALRARGVDPGIGHDPIPYEKEVAALLGIPENLIPAGAYRSPTDDFKPAKRVPAASVLEQLGARAA